MPAAIMNEGEWPPEHAVEAARQYAIHSPCSKSKRGAVAIFNGKVIGGGFNGKPAGTGILPGYAVQVPCPGDDACRANCGKMCVHAEIRAIRNTLRNNVGLLDRELLLGGMTGITILHVKVVDGKVVAGGPPSCLPCATEMLDAGIGYMWLFQGLDLQGNPRTDGDRWVFYTMYSFYQETVRNCRELGEIR